MNYTIEIPSSF